MAEELPEVILFEHRFFRGRHIHVFQDEPNLADPGAAGASSTGLLNDFTSSMVVKGKNWTFFEDKNFKERPVTVKPDAYKEVELAGLRNDKITSLRVTKPGDPPPS